MPKPLTPPIRVPPEDGLAGRSAWRRSPSRRRSACRPKTGSRSSRGEPPERVSRRVVRCRPAAGTEVPPAALHRTAARGRRPPRSAAPGRSPPPSRQRRPRSEPDRPAASPPRTRAASRPKPRRRRSSSMTRDARAQRRRGNAPAGRCRGPVASKPPLRGARPVPGEPGAGPAGCPSPPRPPKRPGGGGQMSHRSTDGDQTVGHVSRRAPPKRTPTTHPSHGTKGACAMRSTTTDESAGGARNGLRLVGAP